MSTGEIQDIVVHTMIKEPLVIANWKSQSTTADATKWLSTVQASPTGIECVVAPPYTLLQTSTTALPKGWKLAAQDVSPFPLGAYTGAVAARQLANVGVTYCIVGHSERRRYFHETNQDVVNKCEQLLAEGIRPVVCIDQPYAKEQLALLASSHVASESIDVAYEPLSAIGTGQPADPSQEVAMIRWLKADWPESRVLYGGSVSAQNVGDYLLIADGVLIATASLDPVSMNAILLQASASAIIAD